MSEGLVERITAYLSGGGLVNPELAIHDAVRDLLIDCRAALSGDYVRVPREQLEYISKLPDSYPTSAIRSMTDEQK
jgi:hypothetical protein